MSRNRRLLLIAAIVLAGWFIIKQPVSSAHFVRGAWDQFIIGLNHVGNFFSSLMNSG